MRTVIFDMYGVILKDPTGNLMPFINGIYPELGEADVYPLWLKAGLGEISSLEFWKSLRSDIDCAGTEKAYLDTIEINDDFYAAAEVLRKEYRLALLSNDVSEWSLYLRQKYGLDRYLDVIMVSGDLKLKKPDPEIFRRTLQRLGQSASDCIYIDDRRHNLMAAQQLGMDVILFNSRSVEYDGPTVTDYTELLNLLMREEN
jgi:putative hydrolase of the HAD superfamily